MRILHLVAIAGTIAMAGGCGSSFSPTAANVAGTYNATRFETVMSGATVDQLAAGATLTIQLAANGTTTGRLFIPGAGENGADVDASLAGTWALSDNTVTFAESADTFVRDMSFTVTENRLTGELTTGGTTIRVTLSK